LRAVDFNGERQRQGRRGGALLWCCECERVERRDCEKFFLFTVTALDAFTFTAPQQRTSTSALPLPFAVVHRPQHNGKAANEN